MVIRQAESRQIAKNNRREESMKDRAKRMVDEGNDRVSYRIVQRYTFVPWVFAVSLYANYDCIYHQ